MPKIILKFEAAVLKELPMLSSSLTIGRKPDNDLIIDHPAISGHHARISFQGDTYFVEDLNSTNGTLVNDKKIIKAGLHNNDIVTLAKHTLIFVDEKPAPAKVSESVVPRAAAPAVPPAPPAQISGTPSSPPPSTDTGAFMAKVSAPPPPPKPVNPESTMDDLVLPGTTQKKLFERVAGLRVLEGAADTHNDFTLKDPSTYLGKTDRAGIKIKGGMMAPDLAALVSRKPDCYVLVAIKEGYPKVNGVSIQKEQQLKEGDIIEVGGTRLQFYFKT